MSDLMALWLPIVVSAVAVFVVSSLIHMVFKWHNPEYRGLPNEDGIRDVLRAANLKPGFYVTPKCTDMKDMASEAMVKKYQEGPVAFITLMPNGSPDMGRALGLWFVFSLIVASAAACITLQAIPLNGNAHLAAHSIALITFIAYGFGSLQDFIWMGKPLSSMLKYLLDALLYSVVTALSFWLLWPTV
jgi:hypothetical protein